ncbi:MAG: hypothetical protein O9326_19395, partial [Microcystis sp. LE19-338.1B]|nr:hypothetical protein [Microcystis sp. LE19-338.1B]
GVLTSNLDSQQLTDNQQLSVILKLVQMYKQPPVSIPLAKLMLSSVWGRQFLHGHLIANRFLVVRLTANQTLKTRSLLPTSHFPLPNGGFGGVESPKSQRLSDKIGNNSQF